MSRTIGSVNFTARIDGRGTPADAERVGRRMGTSASEGFDETWSKGFKDTLTASGQRAYDNWLRQGKRDGGLYGKALNDRLSAFLKTAEKNFQAIRLDPGFLDRWNEKFDDAGVAAGELQRQMVELERQGRINAQAFAGVRRQIDDWANSNREAAIALGDHEDAMAALADDLLDQKRAHDELTETMRKRQKEMRDADAALLKLSRSTRSNASDTDKMNLSWSKIPHNGRQAILIATAIVGGLEQMATLGSAAGAGLLIVGGAAAQMGVGLGATIAVFKDLNGDLDELPERVRPAAEAFQRIGDAFGDMQNEIQSTALDGVADSFKQIEDTVRGLTPAFGPIADVISGLISDFAENTARGSEAFDLLYRLIEQSAPTFDTVMRTLGNLGEALLIAFTNPTMQRGIAGLVGWIDDLVGSFEEFTRSGALDEWLDNGIRIFEAFGGLLEGVATTLNNLVTPEAVDRTVAFLDALTASMPFIEALLAVFGELDIFGLIAETLGTVGAALTPFLEVLEPVASIINDVLVIALQQVQGILELMAPLLIPAQVGWNLLAEIMGRVAAWFDGVMKATEPLREEFQKVIDQVINAFNPAIEAIGDAITAMLPTPEEFAAFLEDVLIPVIKGVAEWIETTLVPAIKILAEWIKDEAVPAAKGMVDYFNKHVGPMLEDAVEWFEDNEDAIRTWAELIINAMGWILNPIGKAIDAFNTLFGAANDANAAANAGPGGGGGGTPPRALARGGILTNPTYVLAGEAGREAYVPLDRPLSQVDESVRWLAAIARGQSGGAAMAQGGITGGGSGRSLVLSDRAIVIEGDRNPEATAVGVVNRIVERL